MSHKRLAPIACLAASLTALTAATPKVSFDVPRVYTATSTNSVAAADFNLDGKMDLVAATAGVAVLLGKGDGSFQPTKSYTAGPSSTTFVTVADLNGDGKPDIVAVDSEADAVLVLLGNGDGTFRPAVSYAVGSQPVAVSVADFDGDGSPDLAVNNLTYTTSSTVSILLNNGDGTFQPALTVDLGFQSFFVAAGDFNGDGKPDLAVPNYGLNAVSILLGNGDGTFQPPLNYTVGNGPESVAVGDFNGDGHLDVADFNFYPVLSISVLLGNGDGTFQPAATYSVSTSDSSASLTVADINGDGKPDLIAAGGPSILLGSGDGTFQPAVNYGWGAFAVAVADFNGDGRPDMALADNEILMLLAVSPGVFRTYTTDPVVTESMATGDFNGDGKLDIAAATSNGISVLLGNGKGILGPPVSYGVGYSAAVAVGDFNGDGKLDLAATNGAAIGYVSILLGNGDGTFRTPVNYPAGMTPTAIAVGDLNGDGKLDLAVVLTGKRTHGNTVAILLGNGDGTFQPPKAYPVGGADLLAIAIGDFNGDGKPDLAVTSGIVSQLQPRPATVAILLGNGDGSFQPPANYAVGASPESVAVADFNRDGILDLAVTSGSNLVSILLGNGDGTFRKPVNYAAGYYPYSVVVADFNSDGIPDLAVGASPEVAILLGNGDGTFQPQVGFAGQDSLVVGDFNGDGKPDLATSGISILLNTTVTPP